MIAFATDPQTRQQIRFLGEPQRMRFVSDLPDYLGRGGPYLHDLGVAALLHDLGKQRLNIFPSSCALNELVPGRAQPPQPYASHVGESVALAQAMRVH